MNDVLPPCGGYLVVRIDDLGYILNYEDDDVIHRETLGLDERQECWASFTQAKQQLVQERQLYADPEELGLLELTSEGGGAAVWAPAEVKEQAVQRLARFKGCYGAWPVRTLEI